MTDAADALRAFHANLVSLAAQISAPASLLPTMTEGSGADDLWVHVLGGSGRLIYQLNYTERGVRRPIAESVDPEDVLEAVFETVTSGMASRLELESRRVQEDSRIQLFAIQEDLMRRLRPAWAERLEKRHAQLLNQGAKGSLKL